MRLIDNKISLDSELKKLQKKNQKIGLIPTMGALHKGHLSLINAAINAGDLVIVSIFVNPTQFNNPEDLKNYPRTLDADLKLLENLDVEIVFAPGVEEMYPEKDLRIFNLSPLDSVMEGKFRPGHFNGVAQIVSKLFLMVSPDRAYFGQKDFQQLAIIKKLTNIMGAHIEIIGCPTIREEDGLAMSSRNTLLNEHERNLAPVIYQTLKDAKEKIKTSSPDEIRAFVNNKINEISDFRIEYFDIVNSLTLNSIDSWKEEGNKIACIAVHLNEVRLIDNLKFV